MIVYLYLSCLVVFCHSVTAVCAFNQANNRRDNVNSTDFGNINKGVKEFKPTWDSLDSRPLPAWYDEAKFGIFVHWGVFSVPSWGSEWFWQSWKSESGSTKYRDFMKQRYPPNFTYQDFARDFTAEFYNATEWSKLFEASGAKYVILTSKHFEGYTMWPSKYSFSWNSKDVGPNRDLVGELAAAIRKDTEMKFGLHHALYEWYNPIWLADQKNGFRTDQFVKFKALPELYELVDLYKPEVIWSDGEWEASDTYWRSKDFLAWLYNESPVKDTVVVNDRWGQDTRCRHGDYWTCSDRYNPGVLQRRKWENAMTIDKRSWGHRRNAQIGDYLTLAELVRELVSTVSCGGNLLMSVGPTKDGIIVPIYQERLRDMGLWLSINGEAIFNTKPWKHQNDTLNGDVWYTQSNDHKKLYAIVVSWPRGNVLYLGAVKYSKRVKIYIILGPLTTRTLNWKQGTAATEVTMYEGDHKGHPAWVICMEDM